VAGLYLGEIVRRVIVTCVHKGLLFNGVRSRLLEMEHRFMTKYISAIERYMIHDILYIYHFHDSWAESPLVSNEHFVSFLVHSD